MTKRSVADLMAHADELAATFEAFTPAGADFDASLAPLMAVKLAAYRWAAAEKDLAEAVHAAREAHSFVLARARPSAGH